LRSIPGLARSLPDIEDSVRFTRNQGELVTLTCSVDANTYFLNCQRPGRHDVNFLDERGFWYVDEPENNPRNYPRLDIKVIPDFS